MTEKFILITAGNPASGKDSYADYFSERFDAKHIGMSSLIKAYAAEKGLTLKGRSTFHAVHSQLRAERGEFALPEQILAEPAQIICVSGLRNVTYQNYLHEHGAETVAFWRTPSTRHRYAANDPARKQVNLREFWLDELPEYFSREPHGMATVTVMNNAHHNVSIEGKTIPQVASETDAILIPQLTHRGLLTA